MDDLARSFFDFLYDQRVPIAIGSAIAVGVAAMVTWRRGWFAAARRHPGRTGVAIALAIAVGGPVTWYLASPIWVRTSLVEAGPSVAPAIVAPASAAPSVARASSPPSSAPSAPSAAPSPTASPFAPRIVSSGEFEGTDEFHFGRGFATLTEVAPGRFHLRLDDFSVRNGPDLYVYLSPDTNDYADDALELGRLKATDGSFGYDVPEGTDVGRFRSAIIWCKQFSHLFAVARF